MSRPRKTRDCWRLYVNYGQGWEHEVTEYVCAAAREQLRCYRKNCSYPAKLVSGREMVADPRGPLWACGTCGSVDVEYRNCTINCGEPEVLCRPCGRSRVGVQRPRFEPKRGVTRVAVRPHGRCATTCVEPVPDEEKCR